MNEQEKQELNQFLHENLFITGSRYDWQWHPYAHLNPDYCGNIADAWRVVEKMREKGLFLTLLTAKHCAQFVTVTANGDFVARFFDMCYGETDTEAICLAAQSALKELN